MGAKVAFFPCPSSSLPLRSPEVSNPHSVAFFPCPDRSLGLPSSVVPTSSVPLARSRSFQLDAHSPSHRGVLALCQAFPCDGLSHLPPLALPYTLGPNASGAATVALSAPPADPMPAGPLAMASAACTTGSAPLIHICQCLRLCRPSRPCQQAHESQGTQETQVRWPLLAC